MYSRLRIYFSSRMGSVCVSLLFCVPYLRFHFRSRRRSFWVWVTLCRLSAFRCFLLCSIFPFFFFIRYTVCTINPFRFVLSLCAFFFCLCFFFQPHLIFPFSRNSMQFLSPWSCISKKKPTFEGILKCIKFTRIRGSNKLRRVRCWNGDVLEISLLVNPSCWLEIWSVFYVQCIKKWVKCVLIQKRRLL